MYVNVHIGPENEQSPEFKRSIMQLTINISHNRLNLCWYVPGNIFYLPGNYYISETKLRTIHNTNKKTDNYPL